MSIYNKVSELEWYLCQKALLKEFLSKNAYEKYLSDLDRFHAECAACKCKRHCEDFVMPNSTRCKCNFMDHLRRKRWRRIRRIFR